MNKIIIDTNIYVAFKKNDPVVISVFQRCEVIAIDPTVLAELLSGFRLGQREEQNRAELREFLNSPRVHILIHDLETAEFYSHLFSRLKTKGRPVPTHDIWIAACALQNGLALYSLDHHFQDIEGVLMLVP